MQFVRRSAIVHDLDTAVGRALAGAAFLDRRLGPGWERLIDLERLDIGSACNCVLGQLSWHGKSSYPGIRQGIEGGLSGGIAADLLAMLGYRSRDAARTYALLTTAWKLVLTRRLNDSQPAPAPSPVDRQHKPLTSAG